MYNRAAEQRGISLDGLSRPEMFLTYSTGKDSSCFLKNDSFER
jgi:hypothetical protein